MTARGIDRAIEALARTQHGAFARRQALPLGMSTSAIDRRVRSGAWLRLGPSVYALPGNPPTWHRQLMAAVLSVTGSAIAGRPAASLRELTGYRFGRPELVVPRGGRTRSGLATIHRYDPGKIDRVAGIPVVSAAQALVDVAPTSSAARVRRALDDLVGDDPAVLDEVRARYLACRRRGGLGGLRRFLDEHGDGYVPTRSELEVRLREVVGRADCPRVVWEAPLPWDPGSSQRVDGLIDDWGVILEADGRRWHSRVADFERDHERDLAALRRGFVVARFTWAQLDGHPDACIETLQDIGRSRTRLDPVHAA